MVRVISLGGAPSSGTTLFCDLLDAIPGFAAPPELNIFCSRACYQFSDDVRDSVHGDVLLKAQACYVSPFKFFNRKYFGLTGMTMGSLEKLVEESVTLPDFIDGFAAVYGEFRGRDIKVFVEKTPANANCSLEFCEMFPDGLFVHVVRDGRDVVSSLVRRGYTCYEANLIWQMQVSQARRAAKCKNYIEVRYEEIISKPYSIAANISNMMGCECPEDIIEMNYYSNEYRKKIPRISSWHCQKYGEIKNDEINSRYLKELSVDKINWLQSSLLYQNHHRKVYMVSSFKGLLKHYGYDIFAGRACRDMVWKEAYAEYILNTKNYFSQLGIRVFSGSKKSMPLIKQAAYLGFDMENFRLQSEG